MLKKNIIFNALVSILLCAMTAAGIAAEGPNDEVKTAPGPTVVQIPVVLLPIADQDGRLLRYAFVTVELEIPRATDRWSVEDMLPVIKDAFVRELHSRPNTLPDNPDQLDVEGIRSRLFERVNTIISDGRVGSVIFRGLATPE